MSLLLFICLFLILSAFFSGSEIAFVSANKLGIEVQRNKGSRRGRIIAHFYEKPREFLGTMLVGNNIALVVFTFLMTTLLQPYVEPYIGTGPLYLLVTTIIITLVVLLIGEFLPKTLFRVYSNDMLHFLAYPLLFFSYLLAIPAWIVNRITNILLKYFFRAPVEKVENVFTRLDLEDFVQGTANSSDEDVETDMFKNALHLEQVKVRECMVPRNEVVHIDVKASIDDLIALFKESRHSRILVTRGDIDEIMGYIHHHQLVEGQKNIRKMVMEIKYVPESMNVLDLLFLLVRQEMNMVCVVDEFGGVSGIVTLEDILEEIFGEIEDEHDPEPYIEEEIDAYQYRFSGRLEIDYLNEKYENLNIPEGEYHTLSGTLS